MLIKIHKSLRMCVAVCDKELIDKKFEDSEKQLDLTGTFFKGEEKTKQEAKDILLNAKAEDSTFNFVGERSTSLAKELGIANEKGVIQIQDIPIALILL